MRLLHLITFVWATSADAAPIQLAHQLRLVTSAGAPLEGAHDLRVSLWSAETGGTRSFTQLFDDVAVAQGFVSVLLDRDEGGALLDSATFGAGDRWVEVQVDGTPLGPRRLLTRAPYAAHADAVSGPVRLEHSTATSCTDAGRVVYDPGSKTMKLCNGTQYVAVGGAGGGAGSGPTDPGATCRSLFLANSTLGNGPYWIDPDGGATTNSFRVYCDMTNGGWTRLVPSSKSFSWRYDTCGGSANASCVPPAATSPSPNRLFGRGEIGQVTYVDESAVAIPTVQLAALDGLSTETNAPVQIFLFDTESCSYYGIWHYYDGTSRTGNVTDHCNNVADESWGPNQASTLRAPYVENSGRILKAFDPTPSSNWGVHVNFVDTALWVR